MNNARFIAFTSALGGSGTTSLALIFGRTLTRLYGKNVTYLSMDLLSGKGVPSGNLTLSLLFDFYQNSYNEECINSIKESVTEDEFGLKYLTSKEPINPLYGDRISMNQLLPVISRVSDYVLLDIPSNCIFSDSLALCEDIIVNFGYKGYGNDISQNYYEYLFSKYELSNIHTFKGVYDEFSFENGKTDIHGEFGAEVRRLVAKLKI